MQGVVGDEIGNFISEYIANARPIRLPSSRHEGRLDGMGTSGSKLIYPSQELRSKAHLYVLHHMTDVNPYVDEHMIELRAKNPSKGDRALMILHNKTFIDWFHRRVMHQSFDSIPATVNWLAYDPRDVVQSYEGYDVNGYTF